MDKHKKILIIEDNTDIALALQEVLSDVGHIVELAHNGKEGLDLLINHDLPDLILLDLSMPVMDGQEFRKRQLEIPYLSLIPVLIMSADAFIKERARISNVELYIRKPFGLEELLEKIEEATKKRPDKSGLFN